MLLVMKMKALPLLLSLFFSTVQIVEENSRHVYVYEVCLTFGIILPDWL